MKGTTNLQPRQMKMTTIRMAVAFLAVAVLGAVGIAINQDAQAQSFQPPDLLHVIDPLSSLKSIPVPEPRNIARYIKDRNAAIALGKALFWDMAVGSDGQSCGSCHFHAGADSRSKNQLNPGFRAVPSDNTFSKFSRNGGGPNYQLKAADFPFHQLADVNNQNSAVVFDTNDISSSAGVFNFAFTAVGPLAAHRATDIRAMAPPDPGFNFGGDKVSGAGARHTPPPIKAGFNPPHLLDGPAPA